MQMAYVPGISVCALFLCSLSVEAQEQLAVVQDERISECSGLACSSLHKDAVWMHNDSGDKPRLFLVGLDGKTQSVCHIRDADAVDWEDMCSFRQQDQSWLLIGDVGDNGAKRTRKKSPCTLYLLKEPSVSAEEQQAKWDIRIRFEYEDGPHNCEGVAVDVEREEILLLTKESPLTTGIYRLPLNTEDRKQNLTAQRIARLPMAFATGLDISRDSRLLMGITMWEGWICERKGSDSWAQALKGTVHRVALPQRRQGESVCFSANSQRLLVNSEKTQQPLWALNVRELLPTTD